MKKKQINILLLIFVLFIWGKLIYKYTKNNTQPTFVVSQSSTQNKLINVEKREFKLQTLKRDPFLNKAYSYKTKVKLTKSKRIKKTITQSNFRWPKIAYFGYITKTNASNAKLAILKINGQIKNIKEKTYINESIFIKKIYKDSVIIKGNNKLKTIIK